MTSNQELKSTRLHSIACTECKCTMLFSFAPLQQPERVLCHSCMVSYARCADILRDDGKEFQQIELRRIAKPVLAPQLANEFVGGLQALITLRKKSRNANPSDNLVSNMINILTIS